MEAIFWRITGSTIPAALAILALSACVSVKLGPEPPKQSDDVSFEAPKSPFEEFKPLEGDRAWRNAKTGNSISYRTGCGEAADLDLEEVHRSTLEGINNLDTEKNEKINYNGREALHSISQGRVDGVPTKIELLIFKKNNCTYTLSYIGVKGAFDKDRESFENFTGSFKAP